MLRADPSLGDERFAVVLGFESPTDSVFQQGGRVVSVPRAVVHTGGSALAARDGMTIRLSSLLADKTLPDHWTLAGVYVYADGPANVTLNYVKGGVVTASFTRAVSAKKWTPLWVDISALPAGPPGDLTLKFDGPVRWVDDVVLVDNTKTLVDAEAAPKRWVIERKGSAVVTKWPDGKSQRWAALDGDDVPADSYAITEANAMRLVLKRADGSVVALYSDGRAFADAVSLAAPFDLPPEHRAPYTKQHSSVATIEVAEETGQIDRVSPGDVNNDGYNETTGVYRVIARIGRVDWTIHPHPGSPIIRPIIEIANMPPGTVGATIEGKWVETSVRTPAGHVLVEVPLIIERPITLNVGVR